MNLVMARIVKMSLHGQDDNPAEQKHLLERTGKENLGTQPGDKEGNYHNPQTGRNVIIPTWIMALRLALTGIIRIQMEDGHRIYPDGRVE